jgi:hypothetical protein
MTTLHNIFACLVHESQECVLDLVRNLRFLDPSSTILLYDGGRSPQLLDTTLFRDHRDVICHPSPQPMSWGRLHDFALDCMRFALDHLPFDTLTIVDSDQLATRAGYSEYLSSFLRNRDGIGLLGSSAQVMPPTTHISPVQNAFQEIELWRPFLRRFPHGEQKFVHWSFWPSTIITEPAARDVTRLFATDTQLQQIMHKSKIWATEEVILPTAIALLGYEVTASPCSYDYVQYRVPYTLDQIEAALFRPDVFWLHPIPRRYDDPLRLRVREKLSDYRNAPGGGREVEHTFGNESGLLLTLPVLDAMKRIEGWLTEQEADLLLATTVRALSSLPADSAVVEVGSYCGRSTVVLGKVVKAFGATAKVHAFDPHDGIVGAVDQGLQHKFPTLAAFQRNMAANGLLGIVESIAKRSFEVVWRSPVGLLLIDHLHDYPNVARDFRHFEPWLVPGAYIAFHDYADYYPGVKRFVNELLSMPQYQKVRCHGSLMVLRLDPEYKPADVVAPGKVSNTATVSNAVDVSGPLVSCIMPTADRRTFIPQALRHFMRQGYANRELIILDDGTDPVGDLIPQDDRIRYVRMQRRLSMGAKHNMACELARGDVIVHWDDDDWIAGRRLSYQVKELLSQPVSTLCGLSRVLFYDPQANRAWEYTYAQKGAPWVAGATFCYYKRFWENHRFPDMNEGADTVFVWNLQNVNVIAHQDYTFYVGTVHAQNTSLKRTETHGWRPLASDYIRSLLEQEDWSFYEKVRLRAEDPKLNAELHPVPVTRVGL